MLRGISTSDWHLGGMLRVMPDPVTRMMEEVHKPFRYALENGIKHVFVPGDISDSDQMDSHTFIQLMTLILTYDQHLVITYLRGNHDVAHKYKTSLDTIEFMANNGFFKNFRVISSPKAVSIRDVSVGFLPFPYQQVKAKRPPLIFAHVEEPGALGDNGRPLRVKEDQVRRVAGDFMISGHIHQYQVLEQRRTIYNGSLYQKNFGESLPKGFIDFTAEYVKGRLEVNHEFINSNPNFELRTVKIKKSSDWDRIKDDPSIRYKVLVDRESGVVVPKDITISRPNIVYLSGVESLTRVKDVHELAEGQISQVPKFSPVRGLRSYLEKSGLDKALVNEGLRMSKEAWKYLSR